MDNVSWGALALSLTVLGGISTWWALRHRGLVAAVRGAGITLLPIAAWLTGLLEVAGSVGDAFAHWFTRLVFSPTVWAGVIVLFVAVVLIGGANLVSRRSGTEKPRPGRRPKAGQPQEVTRTTTPDPLIDDEMAEIKAILNKRGIS